MSTAMRALLWKEWRQFGHAVLAVPFVLLLLTAWMAKGSTFSETWGDILLIFLGPVLAAQAGAMGFASERPEAGLSWLRARAVDGERILLAKLGWQALYLVAGFATSLAIQRAWPAPFSDGWSRLFDAPSSLVAALAATCWFAAFAWAASLSWLGLSTTVALLGALLLTWGTAVLVLAPGAWIGGRPEEALSRLPWLMPALLGPPLFLAAWAFRRWSARAAPRSRRPATIGAVALAALALAGWLASLPPAFEARALRQGVDERSVELRWQHDEFEDLVARQVRLKGGAVRLVFDDGQASRIVLPRGVVARGFSKGEPLLLVEWPGGFLRAVGTHGSTRCWGPGLRYLDDLRLEQEVAP